ncbi:MAG: aldo/keto reductase, partial [Deltaproteobacteria bacterium]
MHWLEERGFALVTRESLQMHLKLTQEKAEERSKKLNLISVEVDVVEYRKHSSSPVDREERDFGQKTGLRFFVLGIGTIWLGRVWPPKNQGYIYPSDDEIDEYLKIAFSQATNHEGIVFIDTAAAYGLSEEKLGAYFRRHPKNIDRAFICTKWGEVFDIDTGKSHVDHSISNLRSSLEISLRRLGKVNLLYIHKTSIEVLSDTDDNGVMREMERIKQEGVGGIRYIGASISAEPVLDATVNEGLIKSLDAIQMPAQLFLKRPDLIAKIYERGIAIVINSVVRDNPREPREVYAGLLKNKEISVVLTGTRHHLRETINYVSSSPVKKNTYPLAVPVATQRQNEQRYSRDKELTNIEVKGLGLANSESFLDDHFDVLSKRLAELEQLLGRAPPELAAWKLVISTDLRLTEGDVAACNVDAKIVYIHPYLFRLAESKQLEILYHELISHLVKKLDDDKNEAMIDTQVFFIDEALRIGAGQEPFVIDFFTRQFIRIKAFFEGKVIPPYEVEVQPSTTCNARCEWCFGEELRLKDCLKKGSAMSTVIQKIFEAEAEGYKVKSVKFVGSTGDPLLNPNTLVAIDELRKNGVVARIFTNGMGLTYKAERQTYASRLIRLAYLRVSLDAGCDETLRNAKKVKKGSFEKIMEGIRILRDESEKMKTGIYIHVGFVISIDNYQDIELAAQEIIKAGAHGIQYRMDFNPKVFRRGWMNFLLGILPSPLQKLISVPILRLRGKVINNKLESVRRLYGDKIKITIVNDKDTVCTKCYYPYLWVTIGSDGQFYPCGHRALAGTAPLGNILEPGKSFMEVFSEQIELVKKRGFPDADCKYCPPVALHASNLLQILEEKSHQPGFIQALDALYEKYTSSPIGHHNRQETRDNGGLTRASSPLNTDDSQWDKWISKPVTMKDLNPDMFRDYDFRSTGP